ncbi:hypothetical protein PVK06_025310 [Gossypium arboreum]|uniref:Uncharacterized protein n=1 Tax=Gossypium arboreum TaxID=29729 RepID=A0ABR0PG47_GOSAR|nr:hypothetical protein PVK06_025310 [Gossypium arboreum]
MSILDRLAKPEKATDRDKAMGESKATASNWVLEGEWGRAVGVFFGVGDGFWFWYLQFLDSLLCLKKLIE